MSGSRSGGEQRRAIKPDYSWRLTERWIDFPWSVLPPVVDPEALAH